MSTKTEAPEPEPDDRFDHWVRDLIRIRDTADYEEQIALIEGLANYIADLEDESAHWRDHTRAVDAICSEHSIPEARADGSRIFTEDRVQMLTEGLGGKNPQRFCIISDGDSRQYLCPVERREEGGQMLKAVIEYWEEIDYDNPGKEPPMPDFVSEVNPYSLTFALPEHK